MKFTRLAFAACLAVFAFVQPLIAEELGRVQFNGKSIILQGDGTWKYADETSVTEGACTADRTQQSKKLPVSFCLPQGWRLVTNPGEAMEFEAVQGDKDIYVGLITERTTMTSSAVREAILYNAASAASIRASDVPIVAEEKRYFSGVEWSYIVYDVNFNGAAFRFANYYRAHGDKGAVQLVFWGSKTYFDEDKQLLEAVASTLVIRQ